MFPPSSTGYLDIETLSGIFGSISIACWVVVFSPQIIENFRRGSADGLSLLFLVVWLAGDIFNILGAVLQGVLPTMIIIAVYYTLADIALLSQCFYYRGLTISDKCTKCNNAGSTPPGVFRRGEEEVDNPSAHGQPSAHSPLLANGNHQIPETGHLTARGPEDERGGEHGPEHEQERELGFHHLHHHHHQSTFLLCQQNSTLDGTHLSPTMPLLDPGKPTPTAASNTTAAPQAQPLQHTSTIQIVAFNIFSVALVCAAGVLGWYVSSGSSRSRRKDRLPSDSHSLKLDPLGQIFGYLCAALYLGSRIPQLLLNYKRKSTEGVSLLFFLFACVGNLTYILSIFAYLPRCKGEHGICRLGEQRRIYARYILVNASWLLGSLGTLILDLAIFVQFILYKEKVVNGDCEEEE
ncbi:hypothetical protein GX48_02812 [Paracoccidioides brasiliensis]|nr:hypothetical protein GX48_02812 [Paracoccidioides brasiliensis]